MSRKGGRPERYPWTKWSDGKPRRASKGKDFTCTPSGFVRSAHSYAKRSGLKVVTNLVGDSVEFQFSKPSSRKAKPARSR